MEKLVTLCWRPTDRSPSAYVDTLLHQVAPALSRAGAHRLRMNVVDEAVAHATGVRLTQLDPPFDAVVTYWLDDSDTRGPLDDVLTRASGRTWSFLTVESVPLVNQTHLAPAGARTPGINMIACITPKPGLAYDAFIEHWHTVHREAALETQCTYAYVRNEIVRRWSPDAPRWAAIVEEGFPTEAVTNPHLWYKAGNDDALYKKNFARMMESCMAFLDLSCIESHPMSEYVFER